MDQATINTYNKYAKAYDDEVIHFWDNFPQATINTFCEKLPGKKILDLGSGSGRDALLLRNKGLEVICVDASAEMVKITRTMGFQTTEADFSDYDFEKDSFDGVWAYTSLLHITKEQTKSILTKIYQSLKPNGIFLIGMIEGTFEGLVERKNMPGEQSYFRFYEEKELKEMIEEIGFTYVFQERYVPHAKTYLAQVYKKP